MINQTIATPPGAVWLAAETGGTASSAAWGCWLVIALPLVSAALLLLAGRRADKWGHLLGVAAPAVAFCLGVWAFFDLLGRPAAERVQDFELFQWIPGGVFDLGFGLRVDQLSLTFVLLVTFVGTLIHIYSVAYMAHDPARRRFFAYLNLFVAAMLLLVLADSYLVLFVGWEGVGLASYLLIGFWNQRLDYAVAAKKAFVANRVGDFGMLVAMMVMFTQFHSVKFDEVFSFASWASPTTLTVIALALLLAACGKSAQFPLQSWLGDAMAGPTPVSALIHAATMVTAGVYLVVRSGPIFEAAPHARLVVLIVGAITLLYGAIVGCAKDDMKKALAASTMSQIGYMMLAAGLGPVGAVFAIMHLVTHGFFKAGMFLGAGSVMHAMRDQVDMRRFGHLDKFMKITWLTFMMGWLAILGVPPFAGFFSKDKIIEQAFVAPDGQVWQAWVFGSVALLGAGLTAFYMSRLFFMVFHGKARWSDEQHPHESPALMTVPMIVLALGSVFLGLILTLAGFDDFLAGALAEGHHGEPVLNAYLIMGATFALVVAGAWIAWRRFGAASATVPVLPPAVDGLIRAARADLYQDTVNHALLVRPGQALVRGAVRADTGVVDGAVRGLAWLLQSVGAVLARLQNGFVRSYAATMLAGVILLTAIVLAVWI
ncbi:MAG: NADH-quinone oxidoreductase subunit L [Bifidobacteriaceae bacterium]|jgi:NADH-quinone oxidoreductase subunit L|nr:NADH-quinone oxidoreductase subunit L [Bifidobacteriaceae bacterium]